MSRARPLAPLVALALASGVALSAGAEPPPAKDWEVELLLYAWGPALDGRIERPRGGSEHVHLSFADILESLELGAMGRLNARWRRWLLVVDGVWTDLGEDIEVERTHVRVDADLDVRMVLAQALGGYRVFARPGGLLGTAAAGDERVFGVDLLAGANYVHLSTDVALELSTAGPLPGRSRHFGGSEQWFAPAVGLRLHNDFTSRLRLETLGTAGGFGVGDAADISWQLTTLLSYRFAEHWSASVGHRLVTADGEENEIEMSGAILGVGYRF